MKVTFLGTGTSQGVPVIGCHCEVCNSLDFRDKRMRSSVHVEVDGLSIVIDTGPDFRQQMLQNRIEKLDAVLFTHEHKDHTGGLDDTRPFYFKQQADIQVYATTRVIEQLKREYAYIFAEHKYPGVPSVAVHEILLRPFSIGNVTITPIEVWHHRLSVLGFRLGNFAYITDANHIEDHELEKLKGLDIFVINALQKKEHISHFTLAQAIDVAQKVGAKTTFFTHISHGLGSHSRIQQELPDSFFLAYDGLQIIL